MKDIELTILMPCLNEEETLKTCIDKAKKFLKKNKVNGEILIADNGSTDNSINIANKLGARVVNVKEKGYGSALIAGTKNAYGKYIIMGDSDDSYDFLNLEEFLKKLREGYDLVMGNRFAGGIEKGAMPFSHRYIGTPVLSFIGRLFFRSKIKDFNCGLRGYNRKKILDLNLTCTGMEYASEMIVKAELNKLRIAEVPTTLKKDGRSRKPHLKTFSDGWRHLNFLLVYAPKWLFLIPGTILLILGLIGMLLLINGRLSITNNFNLGIHSMLYFSSFIVIGFQLCIFYLFAKIYAYKVNIINELNKFTMRIMNTSTIKFVFLGIILIILGIVLSIISLVTWKNLEFGNLNSEVFMPQVILANCSLILGIQIFFSSFFISVMNIKHK